MTYKRKSLFLIILNLAILLLGGCSSPDARFYVLTDTATPAQPPADTATGIAAIGIGPVELPEYLDRPQIVTRTDQNELQLAEFDKWAAPLKDNVIQVLAQNLGAFSPGNKVTVYPWKRATPLDYQVTIKITRFDRTVDGDSVLNAHWAVLTGDGGKELAAHDARYTERPAGAGSRATVAAMNRSLERFSQDIANTLNVLRKGL
jgi:uncharacterized protein